MMSFSFRLPTSIWRITKSWPLWTYTAGLPLCRKLARAGISRTVGLALDHNFGGAGHAGTQPRIEILQGSAGREKLFGKTHSLRNYGRDRADPIQSRP